MELQKLIKENRDRKDLFELIKEVQNMPIEELKLKEEEIEEVTEEVTKE